MLDYDRIICFDDDFDFLNDMRRRCVEMRGRARMRNGISGLWLWLWGTGRKISGFPTVTVHRRAR